MERVRPSLYSRVQSLPFFFFVCKAARVAVSKTSLTPSFSLAEHSRYAYAPIFSAIARPSSVFTGSCLLLASSRLVTSSVRKSFLLPTSTIGTTNKEKQTYDKTHYNAYTIPNNNNTTTTTTTTTTSPCWQQYLLGRNVVLRASTSLECSPVNQDYQSKNTSVSRRYPDRTGGGACRSPPDLQGKMKISNNCRGHMVMVYLYF